MGLSKMKSYALEENIDLKFGDKNQNKDQALALLQFKHMFTINSDASYCLSGLQNLQKLYLSSNHLNGTIPSWIFSPPSLEVLDLSNNHCSGKNSRVHVQNIERSQLEGPIPKSFLNQPRLRALLLSQNNLSGQIDSTICNLETMYLLDLGSNNLKGTIPQCLSVMSEVQILDLS
ncbi:hypothetical protein RND71_002359 [Anisodus tanguticus]|uniref:Toll-like receptor 3 n=1 Tax=Anisodus tanguticus TaxID=243964 RepID=A0AAE1VSZ9_9SOLA|nr:hypothetical protein RND71_002359 [Anisodus tanguticus]